MKLKIHAIKLFTIGNEFNNCIVIPFPTGGKIIDKFTIKNDAVILVLADVDSKPVEAHFHALVTGVDIYTDSFDYIGIFEFYNIGGMDKIVIPVARIPEGDYGIHSVDYIKQFGSQFSDMVRGNQELSELSAENEIRAIQNPDNDNIGREDKNDNSTVENSDLDTPIDGNTDIYGLFGINNPNDKTRFKDTKRKYKKRPKKEDGGV